jgi:hypothetical protein
MTKAQSLDPKNLLLASQFLECQEFKMTLKKIQKSLK